MGLCDLHVHSWYSDGSMSPREIAERARERGVTLLSIADHDVVEGSLELGTLCADMGIRYLSAVEHTCLFGNVYHVLSYGADLSEPRLLGMIHRARRALDGMSDVLIERMGEDFPALSLAEYREMEHDRSLGGWKGIEYLMKKGVTRSLKEGLPYYARYGVRYEDADFPSMRETAQRIHAAGGRAVLAHPGEMIDSSDLAAFARTLESLLDQGLDGIECHYPTHSAQVRDTCLSICERRGLLITAGSDCHGAFSGGEIGCLGINEDQIRI